ncbi:MAG TPA: hypothetical protein VK112_06630 [Fodinibius sp.]|nr:hypothetical protein [Fodinibius sp.]
MRALGLLLLSVFLVSTADGQSTEYSALLNSGLFSFGGKSATQSSAIIVSDVSTADNYTNNPYGSNKALSYGLALRIQRVTSGQGILGIQLGYEVLRSKVHINQIFTNNPASPFEASGQTVLKHRVINIYPAFGYRSGFQGLDIDLTAGPEFGFNLSSREVGEATLNDGSEIKTDTERQDPGTDIRLRSSVTIYYGNWGVSGGYSYGLRNYSRGLTGGDRKRFSRFIRWGITYRIK